MKYEILAPAGDKDKLETAFHFGADACYFAGKRWGLRAFSDNFERDEMAQYISYAHNLGRKCYITVNIQAHNADFEGLSDYLVYLESIHADAIIVSDAGIMSLAKQVVPNMPIHLSTQASASNKYSAKFWADQGAKRIILARELSIKEIKEIRDFLPPEVELEAFVHGAMCISYSGSCLLSNYLAGRDSNRGQCVQACRWEYYITEKTRAEKGEGEEYQIQQDTHGTYILNSKDLCMIDHLDALIDAGVTSFKIEGRMKSSSYVATVVNAYRRALDQLLGDPQAYKNDTTRQQELEKSSHRLFTTGFYFGAQDKEELKTSYPVSSSDFIAKVLEDTDDEGFVKVEMRNRFKLGDKLEVLSPDKNFNQTFVVSKMFDAMGAPIEDVKDVQQIVRVYTPFKLHKLDILRRSKSSPEGGEEIIKN